MKIVNIDLEIKATATKDDYQRYNAVLDAFNVYLFKHEIGEYGGRETEFAGPKSKTKIEYDHTNYWFVLDTAKNKAVNFLKNTVKNFKLDKTTRVCIGNPVPATHDYKKAFKKQKKYTLTYYK